MTESEPELLRPGLLADRRIALCGVAGGGIAGRLGELGARLETLGEDTLADEDQSAAWARERAPLDALLVDARARFSDGGPDGLERSLDLAWRAARAVATGALIESERPGRLLLIAPPANAGEHAQAARAALENLARTLSVEWARFGITAVALAPGDDTGEPELASVASYLISPAGAYFSGCVMRLGSLRPAS